MDKVALITGGGRGIGFGIAMSLARDGVHPVIMDLHPQEAVVDNLDTLAGLGVNPCYVRGDDTHAGDRQADAFPALTPGPRGVNVQARAAHAGAHGQDFSSPAGGCDIPGRRCG